MARTDPVDYVLRDSTHEVPSMNARILLALGLAPIAIVAATTLPCGIPLAFAQETKVAALKAETKAKPKDAVAAFALGKALRRAGRWTEAKAELLRAATLATGDDQVKARYELALVEFDQGVSNKALPVPPSLATCKNVKIGKLGEALSRVCAAEAWLTFARASMAEDELAAASKIDANLYEVKLAYAMVDVSRPPRPRARRRFAGSVTSTSRSRSAPTRSRR
jgi:hypothetical protein